MRISEDEARLDRLRMYMRWFDDQDVEDRHKICYSVWDGYEGPSCFPTDPTLAEFLSLQAPRKRRCR